MQNPDPIKSTGKGMLYAAWALAFILFYMFFDGILDKQHNPNSRPTSIANANRISVTLDRNRFGHYLSTGKINGYPVVFLVDTGASNIAIPEDLANKIGLSKGYRQSVSTANGNTYAWSTEINSLELGDIQLHNIPASINPGMNHSTEVLLGMSALKQLDFAQQGNQLILTQYISSTTLNTKN